jgi:hypothetical protein
VNNRVPVAFVDQLAEALEKVADQARGAVVVDGSGTALDLLSRHLRFVAKAARGSTTPGQPGVGVTDWRLALLHRSIGRQHGVTLNDGRLGFSVSRLAVAQDGLESISVDRLLNVLTLNAVEERFRADATRIESTQRDGFDASREAAKATSVVPDLERRIFEAEDEINSSHELVAQLRLALTQERERTEFLRGFVPQNIAEEAGGDVEPERPDRPTNKKVAVDGQPNIYLRTRGDGSQVFQARRREDGRDKTQQFDELAAAIAWRDEGVSSEAVPTGPETTPLGAMEPGPSSGQVGSVDEVKAAA